MPDSKILIIGAGPAGLTAALRLTEKGHDLAVLEQRDKLGGIACTEEYKGFLFDMGGHRFFTKDEAIREIWQNALSDDFLRRGRLSRIYYNDTFFNYPLKPVNTLRGMGLFQSMAVIASYLRWRTFPYRREETFERWVTNRFGRRLFRIFFKTYTEKVWGIPCSEISAVWAAQRIKDLSLRKAVANMLSISSRHHRSLIDEFDYPRKGPSMMWEALRRTIESRGGSVRMRQEVTSIRRDGFRIEGVVVSDGEKEEFLPAEQFVSSMPVTTFVKGLDPPPPQKVLDAARALRYRDFLTVCLIVNKAEVFPDQWIYVHDPAVKVGRIQNYKNWSPEMVPDAAQTGLGLEYFCQAGDALWTTPDDELLELGKRELSGMGLVDASDVIDGTVFRVPKAYPVYDMGFEHNLNEFRGYVESFENFLTIGRNGLFRYNNMDHSMLSGLDAAGNLTGEPITDLWDMREGQEYLEEYDDDS